jgi:DNA-binding NarL/FixJ family response regulator
VIAAQAVAAVRTGARGYVLKRIATTDLTATITAVLGGGTYVAPRCG